MYETSADLISVVFDGECTNCGIVQLCSVLCEETGDILIVTTVPDLVHSGTPVCAECGEELEMREMVLISQG